MGEDRYFLPFRLWLFAIAISLGAAIIVWKIIESFFKKQKAKSKKRQVLKIAAFLSAICFKF